MKCPHTIFVGEHYLPNGTCRCTDKTHTAMTEWGYVWSEKQHRWESPEKRNVDEKENRHVKLENNDVKLDEEYEHGFDKCAIPSTSFKRALRAAGISKHTGKLWDHDPRRTDEKYRGAARWIWSGNGVQVATSNNPINGKSSHTDQQDDIEKGYAGYVGITGPKSKVKAFVKIIKSDGEYEDQSKGCRNFI